MRAVLMESYNGKTAQFACSAEVKRDETLHTYVGSLGSRKKY